MITFYIVKKKVKNRILTPIEKISIKEFENLVENNVDFIWNEDAFPEALTAKKKEKA